jgi:hypothetical protein
MPRDSVYGSWPRSGEIDVMEARGKVLGDMINPFRFGICVHELPTSICCL